MGKQNTVFKLSNYDYLTKDTPPAGWVWEFMRRSQEYRDVYNRFCKIDRQNISREEAKFIDHAGKEFPRFFPISSKKNGLNIY